jgi:putative salt-induced outer membrane protein YdiY
MKRSMMAVAMLGLIMSAHAAFADDGMIPATPTPPVDVVTVKDGSVIYGEVIEMTDGLLQIKNTLAADIIKVKWAEVSKLTITHPIPFHLKEGTVLVGTVEESEPGMMNLKAVPIGSTMAVPMDTVTQVNPVVQPPIIYTGSVNAAYSQSTGNSHLRNVTVVGDFVARSEQLRLTMLGRYVYGDDNGSLNTRNAKGTIKLDFFITKRFFWFASTYVEYDFFQNLKLRTAIASGPGDQWIDRGDYNGIFKDMTLYTEAGPAYFNEDFRDNTLVADKSSFRGRVSTKWNWPLFNDRITIYHNHEMFPSMQNFADFYLTMDNGIRFKIWEGLASGLQVTTRYNNRPAPGTVKTDNLYLYTLGYAFDTTRKR